MKWIRQMAYEMAKDSRSRIKSAVIAADVDAAHEKLVALRREFPTIGAHKGLDEKWIMDQLFNPD